MMIPRKSLFGALALAVIGLSASIAHADTITFNSLEQSGAGYTIMNSYSELGFTFTNPDGYANGVTSARQGSGQYAGSAGLYPEHINSRLRMTGSPGFSLSSVDLSHNVPNGLPLTITVTGYFVGGGSTTQSFTVSQFGFLTFSLNSSFTNLNHVDFGPQVYPYFQVDNIVVNGSPAQVPEPASLLLLSSGLFGLGAKLRRRTRTNHGLKNSIKSSR